jgi:pimeloyl-ACP methyl ester carboxylesterase
MGTDGVVLVHGTNHCAASWDAVIVHIVAPAIAVELPGRGSRPAPIEGVTLDDCVQEVVASIEQAGFERPALVGHSLGAMTVTETAFRHPERVDRLIYVGGAVPAPGETASFAVSGADMPPGSVMASEERLRTYYGNDMSDEQWREYWKGLVPDSAAPLNSRLTGYPSGIPITYVSMTHDVGVPPALAKQMIANLGADADVDHRVLSAGHIAMVTKPRELAAIINDVVGH